MLLRKFFLGSGSFRVRASSKNIDWVRVQLRPKFQFRYGFQFGFGSTPWLKVEPMIGAGERVQIGALPGKAVGAVTAKAKELERNLVVFTGGVIDKLQKWVEEGGGGVVARIARQIAKGVSELENISESVQIAVYMMPEVER